MVQVQSYQGFFKDGRFMSPQAVKIPENVEVFVTITGREIPFMEQIDKQNDEQSTIMSVLASLPNRDDFTQEDLDAFAKLESGVYKLNFPQRLP